MNYCNFSMINYQRFLSLTALVLLFGCGEKKGDASYSDGAVPPSQALSTFEIEPGFKIELLASEPLINSPVDMEIDENGQMYVVEMPGYPLDNTRTGRIKILRDKDGDGQMDESIVFADGLMFPNGILRWKDGVIITDAPYVLYMEDSDGDGRADHIDTLLTGFSLSNPHVNVNNPVYGLDNWVYLAHLGSIGTRKYEDMFGDKGDEVRYYNRSEGPVLPQNAGGRTVRFRPDDTELEMVSSRTQFGHTFDRWGRYFLTHNQNHIYHEVIAAAYLARNPDLLVPNASESISDHGNEAEVFQITTNPDRQLFTPTGLTTSSSGVTAYEGGIFPPPFDRNVVFGAESVSNLVHVDILEENGATFTAKRHRETREFLASRDSWSRPVNMYIGPDGALYVLDYYRRIIEHPEWMSDEAVEEGGLYDGYDMGRIYRITPEATGKPAWTKGLNLGSESPAEWVQHLASNNIWWRQNAQRLLVERKDMSVVSALEEMVKKDTSPEGRLHALWTLQGMGALSSDLIILALEDAEPGVRENAIKLAENYLEDPVVRKSLLNLREDSNARVRFQLLCTLGFVDTPDAAKVREELLFTDLEDEWVQIAALSASSSQTVPLLNTVLTRFDKEVPAYATLVHRLAAMVVASEGPKMFGELLQKAVSQTSNEGWQAAILRGLADGYTRARNTISGVGFEAHLMQAFFDHPNRDVRNSSLNLLRVMGVSNQQRMDQGMERAMATVENRSLDDDRRIESFRFLSLGDPAPYADKIKEFISPHESSGIQIAAFQTLGEVPGTGASDFILDKWEVLTPEVRDNALEVFLTEQERVTSLLDALEAKKVPVAAIGWRRTVRLMNNSDEELRERARFILTKDEGEEVIQEYQAALELVGDPIEGKVVYMKNCALCHQFRGQDGVAFGPDLGAVHNWLPKDLMVNILDANLSIAPGFDLWEITMTNGEKVQGMIMSETSAAISLRIAPGVEETINRQDISTIQGLNMSLMPGMADQISHQEMADLLAFLRGSE